MNSAPLENRIPQQNDGAVDRVLVVVSDPNLATSLRSHLNAAYLKCHVVSTVRQAIGACRERPYLGVLLSDALPDSESFSVISQLRSARTGQQLPVIMLLSRRDDQAAVSALQCGAQDAVAVDRLTSDLLKRRLDQATARCENENAYNNEALSADLLALEAQRRQELFRNDMEEIVHALRTPLGAINEFLSLAMEQVGGPISEQTGKFLAHARGSCWTLEREIEQLHRLASMDGGLTGRADDVTDLNMALQFVADCLNAYAAHQYVKLSILADEYIPEVRADRFQVCQALMQLVSQAVSTVGNGGEVTLELDANQTHVTVSVCMRHCDPASEKIQPMFKPENRSTEHFLDLPQIRNCAQTLAQLRSNLTYADDGLGNGVYKFELPIAVIKEI